MILDAKEVTMKRITIAVMTLMLCAAGVLLTACGGGDKTDYEHLRNVSWNGTELTIELGENQGTGCVWATIPEDDSVIDYSTNRVFRLSANQTAIGTLQAGFKGRGAGTTRITCTTPVGWDGKGEGFTYIVTVTVNADGTIESAEGKESDTPPETNPEEPEESEATVEKFFKEHPDEVEKMKNNINSDESLKDLVVVDIKAKGNTLSYIYTFKETYSDDKIAQFKPDLKKSMENEVAADMKERIPSIEQGFGVTGIRVYMEYRNGDGKKIIGMTYK